MPDIGDLSVYSINSPNIFPLLTGEGELVDAQGFMCIADYCDDYESGRKAEFEAWAYKVDELPFAQKIYVSKKTGVWELAYDNFNKMLEGLSNIF